MVNAYFDVTMDGWLPKTNTCIAVGMHQGSKAILQKTIILEVVLRLNMPRNLDVYTNYQMEPHVPYTAKLFS